MNDVVILVVAISFVVVVFVHVVVAGGSGSCCGDFGLIVVADGVPEMQPDGIRWCL